MKLTFEEAGILARVFERYAYEADRYIDRNFKGHVEHPKNRNLLVELIQDTTLLAKIYPSLCRDKTIHEGIVERLEEFELKVQPKEEVENNPPPTEEQIYGLLSDFDGK
jgi:hypothetical protein